MSTAEERMQNEIDELEQENRLLRARNERLEREGEMRRLALLDTMQEQKPEDYEQLKNQRDLLVERVAYLEDQLVPVQEPFGYLYEGTAAHTRGKTLFQKTKADRFETRWWQAVGPCYTTPPAAQRQWVGLTPEEIKHMLELFVIPPHHVEMVVQVIEAKLKDKNS